MVGPSPTNFTVHQFLTKYFNFITDRQFEIQNQPQNFSSKYLILMTVASDDDDDDDISHELLNDIADEATTDLIRFYERRIYQPNSVYRFGIFVLRMDYRRNQILFFWDSSICNCN